MSKNNGAYRIVWMVTLIVGTVLAIAGLVWGAAVHYTKLDNAVTEQATLKTTVAQHSTDITTLKTKLELMHDDIKEINGKLR